MADIDSEQLFPHDLFARVDAVLEFIAAYVGVQNSLDSRPSAGMAGWIGLIGSSVGAAAELVVTEPTDADAVRAVSGCLRARAPTASASAPSCAPPKRR